MSPTPSWGLPFNFAGLEAEYSAFESSRVAVLPVPYDFSTSYQGGTRWGPQAILSASRNMEVWDDELGATFEAGIHTLPELEATALGPGDMARRVEEAFDWILGAGKLPVMLGGEHSITAGAVAASAIAPSSSGRKCRPRPVTSQASWNAASGSAAASGMAKARADSVPASASPITATARYRPPMRSASRVRG